MDLQREPEIFHEMENFNDPNFDRKLDAIVAGGHKHLKRHLLTKISRKNCHTIVDYIMAMQTEISPSQNYRVDTIAKLRYFAELHHPKGFEDIERQDVIDFLDKYRKPETVDPLHKWIGSYEGYRIVLIRFFKWLYQPDISHKNRSKPAVIDNIPQIKRKEISIYKPTDLWTEEDDALFYKYCPSSRDRCWHAVSRDTGCRPSELLKLKIKDVIFQQLENGYQIARITVNGKTGSRNVRLCNSLPRLKDWLSNGHPFAGNPNSPLFCGIGRNNQGRRLTRHYVNRMYYRYRTEHFGKALLEDLTVPEEDKRKIRDLVQNKKWNPYVRRHVAATEISKALKDSVLIDKYMGWSHAGNTRQKYQHYFSDDAIEGMLVNMDGLAIASKNSKDKLKALLKPKVCPNCSEGNKPESKFCVKCQFVLSFDHYNEVVNDAEQQKKQMQVMAQEFEGMKAEMAKMYRLLERQSLQIGRDTSTIERQRAKLGEIPPLCPYDTLGVVSNKDGGGGAYPPELEELMFMPWDELERPENKEKLKRLEELLRGLDEFNAGGRHQHQHHQQHQQHHSPRQ